MATIKIASLLLRTLAKPLATKLKTQAKEHEGFRTTTVAIAQFLHKREMQMRLSLLGETLAKHHVKPLNDAKAVEQGANFISESFLFAIAASIISAEAYRSHRKEGQRRDDVTDRITALSTTTESLQKSLAEEVEERKALKEYVIGLEKVLEEVVGIGLRGGWFPNGSMSLLQHSKQSLTSSNSERNNQQEKSNDNLLDGAVLSELLLQQD